MTTIEAGVAAAEDIVIRSGTAELCSRWTGHADRRRRRTPVHYLKTAVETMRIPVLVSKIHRGKEVEVDSGLR